MKSTALRTDAVAINAVGVVKNFGEKLALNKLNLKIGKGEFYGLLGPNGSGKTTTIHILATLTRYSSGAIKIFDMDPSKDFLKIRKSIGLVFQEVAVDRTLTIAQNLRFAGQLHGMSPTEIQKNATPLIELFELEDYVNKPLTMLSGGMRRAVDIIRGLIHSPDILILDEPTIGLDLPNRLKIWKFIGSLRKKSGMTVLLTTHYLEEATDCDRVGFITSGKIIKEGQPVTLMGQLASQIIEVQGPPEVIINIETHLGESVSAGGVTYFKYNDSKQKKLNEVQNRFASAIDMWRVRKPNLNDVLLWTTKI